jgi:hypothetical protein
MSTLILILISTYVQYQPYTLSPTCCFDTTALIHHNSFVVVAPKFQTMNSNQANQEDGTQALAGANPTSTDQTAKKPSAQRPARREGGKKGPKSSKNTQSKRSLAGLHEHDSDISKDRQKKKPSQPPERETAIFGLCSPRLEQRDQNLHLPMFRTRSR